MWLDFMFIFLSCVTLSFLSIYILCCFFFFFFNDTATTEIYTLSLHDALPILSPKSDTKLPKKHAPSGGSPSARPRAVVRSEEHTSELQSPCNLVCRLLLEKKKKKREE